VIRERARRAGGRVAAAVLASLACGGALALAELAVAQDDASKPRADGDQARADLEVFEQAWKLTKDQFYDRTFRGVNWDETRRRLLPRAQKATTRRELHDVIRAMLQELKSSHTTLVEADVWRDHVDNEERGMLAPSLGIELTRIEPGYFVREVVEGSTAAVAGILPGDRLLHVDGVTPEEAALRPAPWESATGVAPSFYLPATGDSVSLELERRPTTSRPGWNIFTVRVEVRRWNLIEAIRASARTEERGPAVLGYVRLRHLRADDVVDVLAEVLTQGKLASADGLVLDLRGDGGLAPVAERTAELFDRGRSDAVWLRPVVALVSAATRGEMEILAWRLRALGIPLVGARTQGAVLGWRFQSLPDGSRLMIASSDVRCLTNGVSLEGRGVVPDVEVKEELRYSAGSDLALEKARQLLVDRVLDARRQGRKHGWF
jgi:C-terminal processing protease CtpA/Prc